MTTMMRKASIVLLFGLVALANAAGDDPPEEEVRRSFIITPKKMDDAQKKLSGVEKMKKPQAKRDERMATLVAKMKVRDAAQKKHDDQQKLNTHNFDGAIKDANEKIAELKAEIKELDEKTIPKAKEDATKEGAEKTQGEADLKQANDQKDAKGESLGKWEKRLKTLNDDKKKQTDNMEEKTKGADDGTWVKALKTLAEKLDSAQADVEKYAEGQWDDPKPVSKDKPKKKLDDGGVAYWNGELVKVQPQPQDVVVWPHQAPQTPPTGPLATDFAPFITAVNAGDITFEGFFDTADSQKFIVKTTKTLEEMKKLFKYQLQEHKGERDWTEIATVEEAKGSDKPCLTPNTLVKISEDLYDQNLQTQTDAALPDSMKDHAATINQFVIGFETIMMEDRKKMKKGDGGKWEVEEEEDEEGKKDETTGKFPMKPAEDKYPMHFINVERMDLSVYIKSDDKIQHHHNMEMARDGKYDVVADQRTMSVAPVKADGTTPDSASTKAEEPSKAWMVVAIIALVVLFLGGAVIAYRAYTASGSSQNTDL